MKIEWPKKPVKWIKDRTLFVSVPFTWDLPRLKGELAESSLFYDQIVVGGPAVYLMPNYLEDVVIGKDCGGILQVVNSQATKTTVGCVRGCGFCAVPQIEGKFRELGNWPDLPIICDNNLLASSRGHFDRVIDRLVKWGWADFNQGLDSRLLTQYHADRIAEIGEPAIRLALDNMDYRKSWEGAYSKLRKAKIPKNRIKSYAMIGYDSTPREAWKRCEWIQSFGVMALPMWYHPLNALRKNIVTEYQEHLGWNNEERTLIMRYYYQKGADREIAQRKGYL